MDFGSLLSVAQRNAKTKTAEQGSKFYSTKFEPPKKESKDKKLSDGIRRFLAQKDEDDRKEKERKKKEYESLMASRTETDKNKIRKMLKVTKSANRSVLDDAVNKTDTAVTLQGPEQPDEDDYGYTSHEAGALYKSLMDKYKTLPEDKKFSKSSMNGRKNGDLMSTKDRVREAILREKEDEKLGRKRSHVPSSSSDSLNRSSADQTHRSRKNLYDPKAEREAEDRRKKELEDEKRKKIKNKRPPPPVMDFQKLLKLAEEKQHQPIQIEVPQKQKEPERLLTNKEKKEIEMRRIEQEERERRRSGLASTPTASAAQKKPDAPASNGRIPKLSSSSQPTARPVAKPSLPDSRKASTSTTKEPIRAISNAPTSKTFSKPSASSTPAKPNASRPNVPQSNGNRSADLKSKSQAMPKQNPVSKQQNAIDSRNVKSREFPPRDLVKTREFPPRDLVKTREFPPRDLARTREFPPRDVQRSHMAIKQKQKPTAASQRRILDDTDESEYDSEMDDFIDDDVQENDYSSEIRKIFGYDKRRYVDDDDDIDNMESSFAQQQREEFVSKKAGLMEDLEDMRKEAEEKARKAKRRRL